MKQRIISWSEVEACCEALACKLPRGEFTHILAIARGGLVPGAMLAYKLNLNIWCTSLTRQPILHVPHRWLVVDDIIDTGQTLKKFPKNAQTAVLFAKPRAAWRCSYFGAEVPQDEWLVFPWAPQDLINR